MKIDTCTSANLSRSPRTHWCDPSVLHPYQALVQQSSSKGSTWGAPHPTATFGHRNTARVNSEQVWLCQSSEKGLKQLAMFMGLCVGLPVSEALLLKGFHFTSAIPQPESCSQCSAIIQTLLSSKEVPLHYHP